MRQGSTILYKTLCRLTTEGKPLHGNRFAHALLNVCDQFRYHVNAADPALSEAEMEARLTSEIERTLMVLAHNPVDRKVTEGTDEEAFRDYRLRGIRVRGVRRYPAMNDPVSGCELFYGLKFCDSRGNPLPSILLGHNGVGKTSFYCALEKAGMGYSDTAVQRGYAGDQINFIKNLTSGQEDMRIVLDTVSGRIEYALGNGGDPPAFPAYFCMERDIEIISKGLSDFYVSRQLGIMEYYLLIKVMGRLLEGRSRLADEHDRLVAKLGQLRAEIRMIERIHSTERPKQLLYFKDLLFAYETLSDSQRSLADKAVLLRYYEERAGEVIRMLLASDDAAEDEEERELLLSFMPVGSSALAEKRDPRQTGEAPLDLKGFELEERIDKLVAVAKWLIALFKRSVTLKGNGSGTIISRKYLIDQKDEYSKVEENIKRLDMDNGLLGLRQERIADMIKVRDCLSDEYREILRKFADNGNKVMSLLFESFYEEDLISVRFVLSGDSSLRLGVEVTAVRPDDRSRTMTAEPRRFLNNFRFKLFCVALKVSMALGCSVLYRLNFPFVMDDVFNSSDFPNRGKIKNFIVKLYEAYESVMDMPGNFQLIFFTQDDIIGESVASGIRKFGDVSGVKYSRIFSYTEAEESDKELINLHDNAEPAIGKSEDKICVQFLEDVIYIK